MEERNAWLSLEEKLLKAVMRCCFFLRAAGVVSPYSTASVVHVILRSKATKDLGTVKLFAL